MATGEGPMERQGLRGPDEDLLAGAARYFGPSTEGLLRSVRELVEAVAAFARKLDLLRRELRQESAECRALLISQIRSMTQLSDEELEHRLRDLRESSRPRPTASSSPGTMVG